LKKAFLFLCPLLLILIVSCSGVPKTVNSEQLTVNNEQLIMNNEQLAMSNEPLTVSNEQTSTELAITEISQPEPIPEEPALADADVEEKPAAEYIETLSMPDNPEPSEIAQEPELQPADQPSVIAMETLSPSEVASPSESVSPSEAAPKPLPALPERRTAQIVPPVRESWRQPAVPSERPAQPSPKVTPLEMPEIAQEPPPAADEQPELGLPLEKAIQPDYPITFSRVARATVGQLVEIPFRGRDWVFLGEVGSRRGIAYDSRKLDTEGESFIFRVEADGVYVLKFYRQDFVRDLILNDHVQIIAGGTPETTGLGWFNPHIDRSRVIAGPRWPNFLEQPPAAIQPPVMAQPPVTVQPPQETVRQAAPPKATAQSPVAAQPPVAAKPPASRPSAARNEAPRPQGLSGNAIAQSSPIQPQSEPAPPPPVPTTPPVTVESVNPDTILKEARDEFNAGRIASALTLLDQFRKFFPSGSDEAWWLYGQCYEANSPNRNMLSALDYYRRLVREYPQSSRLSDARRRISYLEKYYINIQ
jgi:hypothetical protein